MTGNNPNLDLVNVDVHTNFSKILSIRSQDIEPKRNSDVNQGPSFCQNFMHTNFGQILSIRSLDIEGKGNSDINQGP